MTFSTPLWHEHPNDDDALVVLTRMACPAPCVGVVNKMGWHLECERRARVALSVLRPFYPETRKSTKRGELT